MTSVFDRVELTQDVGDFKAGTKAVVFSMMVKDVEYENFTNVDFFFGLDIDGQYLHEVPKTSFKPLRRVDVESVYELDRQIRHINGLRISDIEIYRKSKLIELDHAMQDLWKLSSLSVVEFILQVVNDEQLKES